MIKKTKKQKGKEKRYHEKNVHLHDLPSTDKKASKSLAIFTITS